ncbi:ribosome small subunit-dependent GTPase A [bacterium]|nr:ribosome small subunit-dependent GTPase A [bacterium]
MNLTDLGWNSFFKDQFQDGQPGNQSVGRIINVQKNSFWICGTDGEYAAKVSGSFSHKAKGRSDFPVVGDWVIYKWQPGDEYAIIQTLLNRQNAVSRAASGTANLKNGPVLDEQVMAANIDTVFIVSGLDRDFNLRRIERYLTLVYNSQAMPVIILNKSDLCPNPEEKRVQVESIALGVPVHLISAHEPGGVDSIKNYLLPGYTATLLGSSGVGKSTIINALIGAERQKVRTISKHVGKGTHTTTSRELIYLPDGGMIVDNPGVREIQLFDSEEGFGAAFDDVERLALNCRFSNCSHTFEPGCAVQEAIEDGHIDSGRLQNYQKLKKELHYDSERQVKSSNRIEKEKWKKIKIMQKNFKKSRY